MNIRYSKHSFGAGFVAAALVAATATPSMAGIFNKNQPVPQWGLDAYKTKTPDYAKDAAAVVLYDEYLETVDAQGHDVERERLVTRILKPQGRSRGVCGVNYDVDEK